MKYDRLKNFKKKTSQIHLKNKRKNIFQNDSLLNESLINLTNSLP